MQGALHFDTPQAAQFAREPSEPLMDMDTPRPTPGSASGKRGPDGDLLPIHSAGKRQHLAPLGTPRERIGHTTENDDTDLLLTDEREVCTRIAKTIAHLRYRQLNSLLYKQGTCLQERNRLQRDGSLQDDSAHETPAGERSMAGLARLRSCIDVDMAQ